MKVDVFVIGAGVAGLTAAVKAAEKGLKVLAAEKGSGATIQSSGVIDVAGYFPPNHLLASASEGVRTIAEKVKNHPYSIIGGGKKAEPERRGQESERKVRRALEFFVEGMKSVGANFMGSLDENVLVTNFVGTFKPTCLCPFTMYNGDLRRLDGSSLVLVGVKGFPDYDPKFCAQSLWDILPRLGIKPKSVSHAYIDVPSLGGRGDILAIEIARKMDDPEVLENIGQSLQKVVGSAEHLAIPTCGVESPEENIKTLAEATGANVFEVASFPPSVPGYRLVKSLEKWAQKSGVSVRRGYKVLGANFDKNVKSLRVEIGRKIVEIEADVYILASGGFLGGGLKEEKDFIRESIFNLPVYSSDGVNLEEVYLEKLLSRKVFPKGGHQLFSCGILVDENLQPLSEKGEPVHSNLYAAGSILSGYNYMAEKSGMGVAIATGYLAGLKASS
ncbi:MAG: anaerobic glycerol-3-phosphate dehydrogenase subunit B [Candidatus Freyarchaeota archaeon]|nr:anaerobic glycerol-3-phosphate dehydrogenase subunit B [Candidatus Jordarchaeia archaeon]